MSHARYQRGVGLTSVIHTHYRQAHSQAKTSVRSAREVCTHRKSGNQRGSRERYAAYARICSSLIPTETAVMVPGFGAFARARC